MIVRHFFIIFLVGVMSTVGCGTSVHESARTDSSAIMQGPYQVVVTNVTSSSDKVPAYVPHMIKVMLEKALTENGLIQANERQIGLSVDLKDYRNRGAGLRFMFGVLAGSDKLESIVELVEVRTNQVIATSTVKSFNALAVGDMEQMATQHAEEIARYIQGVIRPTGTK
jgi:hypothetical protein